MEGLTDSIGGSRSHCIQGFHTRLLLPPLLHRTEAHGTAGCSWGVTAAAAAADPAGTRLHSQLQVYTPPPSADHVLLQQNKVDIIKLSFRLLFSPVPNFLLLLLDRTSVLDFLLLFTSSFHAMCSVLC